MTLDALDIVLLTIALFSWAMTEEWYPLGRLFEGVFRMKEGEFFYKLANHAGLVALMKRPLLLAVLGFLVPTPWSLDWILTLAIGVVVEFWKLWRARHRPKLLGIG